MPKAALVYAQWTPTACREQDNWCWCWCWGSDIEVSSCQGKESMHGHNTLCTWKLKSMYSITTLWCRQSVSLLKMRRMHLKKVLLECPLGDSTCGCSYIPVILWFDLKQITTQMLSMVQKLKSRGISWGESIENWPQPNALFVYIINLCIHGS